ncbi:MAG: efflux RND transporter periplasmic adaptor subunit [Sterolibacterium sp.]|jgi:RND family efflux transporter MFP subunit|nr:efflux RND transporter periplasmic adaptor subunit [Sterolibacterium sp.]
MALVNLGGGMRAPGKLGWWLLLLGLIVAGWWMTRDAATAAHEGDKTASAATLKPALTVTVTLPHEENWPQRLSLDGNVVAWQEAVVGAELPYYRISEVLVQVGDRVRKHQVLARIAEDTVANEQDEAAAVVRELEAVSSEARGNAERAQTLRDKGFYSVQTQGQYVTTERATDARLAAARARLRLAQLHVAKASVTAPDDGVISGRSAVVGSLTQPGQELFRLIRGGRIEWHAEAPAVQLARIKPGVAAQVELADGEVVHGQVRNVAPSVDPRTRNGIVYIDLPAGEDLRAGMFARGQIDTGQAVALTIPAAAVVLREGYSYVFVVAGEPVRALQKRVKTGRRMGDRIEIVEGLASGERVVDTGAGFLADGDGVAVVAAASAVTAAH